jgi:hypothetical protein
VCGDFNASLHARKEDEEQYIGPHVFGKGPAFLANKERAAGNRVTNRTALTNLLRELDMKCMNTYFPKLNKYKATYKMVFAGIDQEPWIPDRYAEIDFCLAFQRWSNSIKKYRN